MAGCYPEYLPVLIAAAEAVATPRFHLQAIQATTNPAAVWLIVNGPIARWLEVNGGAGCLGQGAWANATLGRALRLILQNIGARAAGRDGPGDAGPAGQVHVLLRRERRGEPVGAAARRARLRGRCEHGDGRGRARHVEHEHDRAKGAKRCSP